MISFKDVLILRIVVWNANKSNFKISFKKKDINH